MHGGTYGSGAPSGECNGRYRHGYKTREAIADRAEIMGWVRMCREMAKAEAEAGGD